MSIQSPVGTLDIKNATLRVGKLEVSNIQGVDTALNVTRANSILIYDDQASTTTFTGFTSTPGVRDTVNGYLDVAGGYVYWGQKLPNAWVMDFEMDIRSGTNPGPLYANVFSTTNTGGDGYSFTFNDNNDKISLYYDGALLTEATVSGLFTATENWQKVVINYERGMIAISLGGSRKFYYKDIEREKPYVNGEYTNFSSASTDGRKMRNLRIVNGEKWMYTGESNIAYTQGSVGIGVTDPNYTLDVAGDINLSGNFYQGGAPFVSSLWTDGGDALYYRSNIEVGTGNLYVDTTTSRVGINTTTPGYDLDVAGDINFTGTFYQGGSPFVSSLWTSGNDSLYYTASNVGIGTNTAEYTLDVHGNANVGALTVTTISGDGAGLNNIQTSNVIGLTDNVARIASLEASNVDVWSNLASNVARIASLEASNVDVWSNLASNVARIASLEASNVDVWSNLDSNVARIASLEASNVDVWSNLASNVARIASLESGDMTISGDKTFDDNVFVTTIKDASNKYLPMVDTDGKLIRSPVYVTGTGKYVITSSEAEFLGNITLSGNTTVVSSNSVTIEDRIFGIGSNNSLTNLDSGIIIEHQDSGVYANVALIHHADEHRFSLGYTQNTFTDDHVLHYDHPDNVVLTVDLRGDVLVQNNLQVGTANLFVDTTTSNVGIGTSTPGYALDVAGDINLSGDFYQGGSIFVSSLWTSGNDSLYYNASNVGIGVNTANYELDVAGNVNATTLLANTAQIHSNLTVGSNVTIDDTASNVISVDGNIKADTFNVGDFLVVAAYGLDHVTNENNSTGDTIISTNPITGFRTLSNVVANGNVTATDLLCNTLTMNLVSFTGLQTFDQVTNVGNITSNTVQFTNTNTSLVTLGNVGVGVTNPAYKLDVHGTSNVGALTATSGSFSGVISQNGKELYAQKRWDIDLSTQSSTNFYPVEFTVPTEQETTYGDLHPVHFKVFGESLGNSDLYNENTLVGYARGGGWSDHGGMYDVHIRRHTGGETKFEGLYEGTASYVYGIVIYMRGGYKYSTITDATAVNVYTSVATLGSSVFAIKNSSGVDVSGTSANISKMIDIAASTEVDRRWVSGISISYNVPKTRAQMILRNTGNISYNGNNGFQVYTDYGPSWVAYSVNPLFSISITGDYVDGTGHYTLFRLAVQDQSTSAVTYFPNTTGWTKYMYVDNSRLDGHGYHGIMSGLTPGTSYKCRLEVSNNSSASNYYRWDSLYGVISGIVWD